MVGIYLEIVCKLIQCKLRHALANLKESAYSLLMTSY